MSPPRTRLRPTLPPPATNTLGKPAGTEPAAIGARKRSGRRSVDPPGAAAVATQVSTSALLSSLLPFVGWGVVAYGWGMLALYHWKLYHRKEDSTTGTLSGPSMQARRLWAGAYAKTKKDTITAVQSLRNALMIATANSSISVALISVCLGPLLDAYLRGSFPLLSELLIFPAPTLLKVLKFSVLFSLLVAQFVCFTQCCYYWVHLTFMLPVSGPDMEGYVTQEGLVDIAVHAQFFWWWGYRCLYMLIPATVWVVVGTIPFAAVASVMVIALNYLDRPLRKAKPLEYYL